MEYLPPLAAVLFIAGAFAFDSHASKKIGNELEANISGRIAAIVGTFALYAVIAHAVG